MKYNIAYVGDSRFLKKVKSGIKHHNSLPVLCELELVEAASSEDGITKILKSCGPCLVVVGPGAEVDEVLRYSRAAARKNAQLNGAPLHFGVYVALGRGDKYMKPHLNTLFEKQAICGYSEPGFFNASSLIFTGEFYEKMLLEKGKEKTA